VTEARGALPRGEPDQLDPSSVAPGARRARALGPIDDPIPRAHAPDGAAILLPGRRPEAGEVEAGVAARDEVGHDPSRAMREGPAEMAMADVVEEVGQA
jgi:hypothetical protein